MRAALESDSALFKFECESLNLDLFEGHPLFSCCQKHSLEYILLIKVYIQFRVVGFDS